MSRGFTDYNHDPDSEEAIEHRKNFLERMTLKHEARVINAHPEQERYLIR